MDAAYYRKRRERARETMREAGIDALFLVPTSDLYYLTGFRGSIGDRLTGLLLRQDEEFFLYPAIEEASLNGELRESAMCIPHRDGEEPLGILTGLLPRKNGLLAVDSRIWGGTLLALQQLLPETRWLDAALVMEPLRAQKDAEEYRLLREAQLRAGQGLLALYEWGLEGRTEREAAAKLTECCAQAGLAPASWGPIVASGANGAMPHHENSDKTIVKGDPVLIDFGGVYGGYQADMTRCPVAGKASPEFRDIYGIVLAANEAAFRAARPGVPCEAPDSAARALISRAGHGARFTHRLGHGIGLDIHETPYLVQGSARTLLPGMAFSDEP
ncbi:MAG: Xaa-Pro peptidase family protein, partial [Spirochaetaceae bacterium]|nr:Xaa-Pro peptidase family protein [Spirochaetaceae bacterium]